MKPEGGTSSRRLVYAKAADLELWHCRPLGNIKILDLKDRVAGHLNGILLDAETKRPLFLVIERDRSAGQCFLAPVGESWFDQTERAIRIDIDRR